MNVIRIQRCSTPTNDDTYRNELALSVGTHVYLLTGDYQGDCMKVEEVEVYHIIQPDFEADEALYDAKPWMSPR